MDDPAAAIGPVLGVPGLDVQGVAGLDMAKGAYALALHVAAPLTIRHRDSDLPLEQAWYVYVGSARGPGGLRARLVRHMRHDKRLRWHVDALTLAASECIAFAVPGGSKCNLATRLVASGGFAHAVPGFGSSDCRTCPSHLLVWRRSV